MLLAAVVAWGVAVGAPTWTVQELKTRALEELQADGVDLPPRALRLTPLQDRGLRVEIRSDDGESRSRSLDRLPEKLEAAAATVRIVVLELMAPYTPPPTEESSHGAG